jgi:ElaB/YqjD/DUF883 family membrane-anchored ribosome-binding protein
MTDPVTSEQLYEHLRAVIRDSEALLQATASYAGDKADLARAKAADSLRAAKERLNEAKERLADVQDDVMDRTRDYVKQGQKYVRDNPWQSVGLAAGIGILVGVLLLSSSFNRKDP